MEPGRSRSLWHLLEPIHAVTYFAPESRDAASSLGLVGFWMGYFAFRSAPMGRIGSELVGATFFNFHPDRVRRAIPAAWSHAAPPSIIEARSTAAAATLRRLLGDRTAETLARRVVPRLDQALADLPGAGRPLFSANRGLGVSSSNDPVGSLWQAATTVREHRGDGHVAALLTSGLDGCTAHVLLAAERGLDPELFLQSRGWTKTDWDHGVNRLAARGLLDPDGTITTAGRELRAAVEGHTDELSASLTRSLGEKWTSQLRDDLTPAVAGVIGSGSIPFPNPMGLPWPGHASIGPPAEDDDQSFRPPRRASADDASAVTHVLLRSRRASVPAIPPSVHADHEVARWVATVVLPTLEVWVVDHSTPHSHDRVLAVLVLDDSWIDQLYVDPAATGRGVGAQLVSLAKDLRPQGLDLWTFQSNVRACRFYERQGFVALPGTTSDNEERAPALRYCWRPGTDRLTAESSP